MLCQLVCTDRRYQRMNCFNIRELQGILKRKFFTDLISSSDYRDIMDSSMIGLRYKANNNLNLQHNALSFYNLGTTNSSKFRTSELTNNYYSLTANSSMVELFIAPNLFFYDAIHSALLNLYLSLNLSCLLPTNFSIAPALPTSPFNPNHLFSTAVYNFNLSYVFTPPFSFNFIEKATTSTTVYTSSSPVKNAQNSLYSNLEASSDVRYNKFSNPVVSYDYKCGHYLGI